MGMTDLLARIVKGHFCDIFQLKRKMTLLGVTMFGLRGKRKTRKKSGYVFVGYLSLFQSKRFLLINLMGKPVAVFKRPDGTFFSREMACTHDGANLTNGTIDDWVVRCPRHGHQFDINTGECIDGNYPPLKEHSVRIEGNDVYISQSSRLSDDDIDRLRDKHVPFEQHV